jgi:hypothetical protein
VPSNKEYAGTKYEQVTSMCIKRCSDKLNLLRPCAWVKLFLKFAKIEKIILNISG